MQKLINITEKTAAVIHALAFISAHAEMGTVPVKFIAKELKLSESYLAKVLQPLVKQRLLSSQRGAGGGYSLKKSPDKITLLNLLITLEGRLPVNRCMLATPACSLKKCPFRRLAVKVKEAVEKELSSCSIADLAENFKQNKKHTI